MHAAFDDPAACQCPLNHTHFEETPHRPVPPQYPALAAAMIPGMTGPGHLQAIPWRTVLALGCAGVKMTHALGIPQRTFHRGVQEFCRRSGLILPELVLALRQYGAHHHPFSCNPWPLPLRTVWPMMAAMTHLPPTSGADLAGLSLHNTDLSGRSFARSDLRETIMQGCSLRQTCFHAADLRGASIKLTDARGADLSRADMRRAYLAGADLRGADLREANLEGAYVYSVRLEGALMRPGQLSPSHWLETREPEPKNGRQAIPMPAPLPTPRPA